MMRHCVLIGLIEAEPTASVKAPTVKTVGIYTWTGIVAVTKAKEERPIKRSNFNRAGRAFAGAPHPDGADQIDRRPSGNNSSQQPGQHDRRA
jgi:hypothetical protein